MSMPKILGLCNLQFSPSLGEMTSARQLGVTSFLSRYALIDFPLSNFSNSGIDKIGIICQEYPQSVLKHIGNGTSWTSNTKTGLLSLMYNEKGQTNPRFNTDIQIIKENDWLIKRVDPEYIIIAPAHVICATSFIPYLDAHIQSKADVSILYTHTNKLIESFTSTVVLALNRNGFVSKIKQNPGNKESGNASLQIYIISRKIFNTILKEADKISLLFGLSEMIKYLNEQKRIKILGQEYKGYARMVCSLGQYHKISLELLDHYKRDELFNEKNPVYTTTHNTPPSRYGEHAIVTNSFIANGAKINGEIENSIISRNVIVHEGAKIKNCILFNGAIIGPNVVLENVIVDKQSEIDTTEKLCGTSDNPIYIKKGVKV